MTVRNGQRLPASSISGNHDPFWEEEIVPINMDREYYVFFEAETGTSKHTYIALDDVSFTPVSAFKYTVLRYSFIRSFTIEIWTSVSWSNRVLRDKHYNWLPIPCVSFLWQSGTKWVTLVITTRKTVKQGKRALSTLSIISMEVWLLEWPSCKDLDVLLTMTFGAPSTLIKENHKRKNFRCLFDREKKNRQHLRTLRNYH